MRKLAILVAAALFCATNAWAADDCAPKQLASLDMITLPSGKIAVPVSIAGAEQKFIVQLNNPHSAMRSEYADALKLESKSVSSSVHIYFGSQHATQIATLPDLQIGSTHLKDLEFMRVPLQVLPDPDVTGALGMNILSLVDVEFDFKNNKLNLYSQDHCKAQVVYWAGAYTSLPLETDEIGNTSFEMTLDGKTVRAEFVMAIQHAIMNMTVPKALFNMDATSPGMARVPPPSDISPDLSSNLSPNIQFYTYPFKSLSANGFTVNPAIYIFDNGAKLHCDGKFHDIDGWPAKCYGADLDLSMAEMRKLHLWFAFKEKMLYVTAADAHN